MKGGDSGHPSLRGSDLCLGYRDATVLTDATVDIHAGEVTALIGPNGSGKSTLLRSLARLHLPRAGQVILDKDTPTLALSPKAFARRVTLLTQSRPTPVGVSVADVVGYGRHPYRRGWRGDDADGAEAVRWAMHVTGVERMADRGVDELSGGELQRVWLASCLSQKTTVVLLDEPTAHLDLRYQVEILDLVRDLADDHGVAIGIVLHDLQQAADIADRMMLLDQGCVLASGAPVEVMTTEHLSRAFGLRIDVQLDSAAGAITVRPAGRHTPKSSVTRGAS